MSLVYDYILGRLRKKDEGGGGGGGVTPAQLAAVLVEAKAKEWTHTAGRNNGNATNRYLEGPGALPTNQAGFVQADNATIVGISSEAQSSGSWTIEVRKNGNVAILAQLIVSAASKDSDNALSVDVDQGDSIEIYLNGSAIDHPSATVYMRKRP